MASYVMEIKPASPERALTYFESLMEFETDCWDVHDSQQKGEVDYILLDVRAPDLFQKGHIPGATNLPHGKIINRYLAQFPDDQPYVVYCAGPHCNGAMRAAIRLTKLGKAVKVMPGGITGWLDEGFQLQEADQK